MSASIKININVIDTTSPTGDARAKLTDEVKSYINEKIQDGEMEGRYGGLRFFANINDITKWMTPVEEFNNLNETLVKYGEYKLFPFAVRRTSLVKLQDCFVSCEFDFISLNASLCTKLDRYIKRNYRSGCRLHFIPEETENYSILRLEILDKNNKPIRKPIRILPDRLVSTD